MKRGLTCLGLIALLSTACKSGGGETTSAKTAEDAHTLAGANEQWCPEGFESGANDSCFAIPEKAQKDTPILAYLHGMYQGHGSPEEWATVRSAVQKGYAVVLLRGKRGLCPWKAEFKDYYCWPQDPEDTDAMKGVIADWDKSLWQVDALMEQGTHKRYFLAFSNGGFFASYVATHAMFPAQAWAIVDAGSIAPTPAAPAGSAPAKGKAPPPPPSTPPLLLVEAKDDTEQAPKTKELHEALTKSSWPHAYCLQPGGKTLTAADVDQALSFFKRDQVGALKPQGTSYSCEEQEAKPKGKKKE
jgi:predicted esterase